MCSNLIAEVFMPPLELFLIDLGIWLNNLARDDGIIWMDIVEINFRVNKTRITCGPASVS